MGVVIRTRFTAESPPHFVVHLLGLELGQREPDVGRHRRGGGGVVVVAVDDAVLLAVSRTGWRRTGLRALRGRLRR